jgi:hypothetical protein
MAWNLSTEDNEMTLTNEDSGAALLFTIHVLNDDEEFEPISDDYPEEPTLSLAASSSVTIDLVNDGVYKLIVENGSTDTETYFLLDANIKACDRDMLKDLLCDTCDPCASVEFMKKMKNRIVFIAIRNNLYFIWNKWVQTQSVTDLIVPPNDEILYLADLKTQLNNLCEACNSNTCDDCGKTVNISSNCGCS